MALSYKFQFSGIASFADPSPAGSLPSDVPVHSDPLLQLISDLISQASLLNRTAKQTAQLDQAEVHVRLLEARGRIARSMITSAKTSSGSGTWKFTGVNAISDPSPAGSLPAWIGVYSDPYLQSTADLVAQTSQNRVLASRTSALAVVEERVRLIEARGRIARAALDWARARVGQITDDTGLSAISRPNSRQTNSDWYL